MNESIIRYYPDPILRKETEKVEVFDEKLADLVARMRDLMFQYDGVGLAAPQIGESRKIAVVYYEEKLHVLINPVVKESHGRQIGEEGCLSFPGIYEDIERPSKVLVQAQNEKGESFTAEASDFLARAFSHEIDHLNGKLMIDHLSPMKREMVKRKLKKNKKDDRSR